MNSKTRPFLDFYEKHEIIPTKLNIDSQSEFFAQRDRLFESLGILPKIFQGAKIVEVGPGTGQKALHLLSKSPDTYTAVDLNNASIRSTKRLIDDHGFGDKSKVFVADFLDLKISDKFNFVLAELVIPTQITPDLFVKKICELLESGGVAVITCIDPIGLLPEILRKAIVLRLSMIDEDLNQSASRIANFFEQDLNSLEGMDRLRTDWAVDNLINPWLGGAFSVPQAIASLGSEVRFYRSAPSFSENYLWFKNKSMSNQKRNLSIIEEYWRKCHNFIDYRSVDPPRSEVANQKLFSLCGLLYSDVHQQIWNQDSSYKVSRICSEIMGEITDLNPNTLKSLSSFNRFWQTGDPKELTDFHAWWGRATHYVSLLS